MKSTIDPIKLFRTWFRMAEKEIKKLPNAMCLATVGKNGAPSARMVLLKGYTKDGFTFYTNLRSQKGRDISANKHVALTFYWKEIDRQVRIQGIAKKVTATEADIYFATRPRGHQLAAWASNQSDLLDNYETLTKAYRKLEQKYRERDVPRPPHWSGFRVVPTSIEFWENKTNRLHARMLFSRMQNGRWKNRLLNP